MIHSKLYEEEDYDNDYADDDNGKCNNKSGSKFVAVLT
jgi:hypothetical protein